MLQAVNNPLVDTGIDKYDANTVFILYLLIAKLNAV